MFDLNSNILDVAVRLKGVGQRVEACAEAALDRASQVTWQQSLRRALKIYARPIPTRAQVAIYNVNFKGVSKKKIGIPQAGITGKGNEPAWKRTGALLQGEKYPKKGKLTRTLSTEGSAATYAESRHGLGVTWSPARPALGIIRRNPWRDEAVNLTKPQIGKVFEQEFRNQVRQAGV